VTFLLVRTVSALQPVGIEIIEAIPHATLKNKVAIRSRNLQPVLLEKTLCISKTTEHFARQSVRIVRTSDAMKERPDVTQSLSVVVELNFDRPWFSAKKMLPDCARYINFEKRTIR
jgi:hypothetical protein